MLKEKSSNVYKHRKLNNTYPGWLFVSPFLIGFVFYFFWVLVDSLRYSFSSVTMGTSCEVTFIGWGNYQYALFGHATFVRTMVETIGEMLTNIPIVLIFSLFVAVLLSQKFPGRTFFRAVFFIPAVVSVGLIEQADNSNTVLSIMSSMASIQTGAGSLSSGAISLANVQETLQSLKFSPALISYVVGAVDNIITVVNHSGVQIIIFLVGLQSISPSIYESAKMEGASSWEIFWKITFPMISPLILVNLFFSVIDALTRTSNSIMSLIRNLGLNANKVGEASAMSWIYFAALAIVLVIIALVCKRFMFYRNRED